MKAEDGAYFAIKGFIYQFDKTILEILKQEDENAFVKIEQEQDLEYENFVVQVKYHGTKYSESKQKELIGKPTFKLLKSFQQNPHKKYCLYIYLDGKPLGNHKLSLQELNNYIYKFENVKNSISDTVKNDFLNNFEINFSMDFIGQYVDVCEKIQNIFRCNKEIAMISYHAIIRNYLLNILLKFPKEKAEERQTTLAEIKKLINNQNAIVVYSEYAKILGDEKYFKFIKSEFPKINIGHRKYLFIGQNIQETTTHTFAILIQQLAEKYFISKIPKSEPFNIIINKTPEEINLIKKQLIKLGVKFNDGYENIEFEEHFFNEEHLYNVSSKKHSFAIRLISYKTFLNIKNKINPDFVYNFGNNVEIEKMFKHKFAYFSVDDLDIKYIQELVK